MKKTFLLVFSMFLVLGFVSASSFGSSEGKVVKQHFDTSKNNPTPTPSSSSGESNNNPTPIYSSGSLKTRWVYNGEECVKANVLSVPFTIGKNSKYLYPYKFLGFTDDGKQRIQRILSGEKATPINPITWKYENKPNCDKSVINTEPLAYRWNAIK